MTPLAGVQNKCSLAHRSAQAVSMDYLDAERAWLDRPRYMRATGYDSQCLGAVLGAALLGLMLLALQ